MPDSLPTQPPGWTWVAAELRSDSFARVAGCDLSARMFRQSRVAVARQSSPTDLPFSDESFDLITAVCVFHHVKETDRISLARGIRRVLKPGGLFCLIEHNPLNPVTKAIVKRSLVDRGVKLIGSKRASEYLTRAGFVVLSTNYFLFLPERWYSKATWVEDVLRKVPVGGQYAVLGRK
jgi:SAM-dependent methyltransferase